VTGSDAVQDVAVNDPARSIDNAGEVLDSIAPLNLGDRVVQEIMSLMRAGEWDGRKSADAVAIRYGITIGSAKQLAVQAGRVLRLHREPDQMLGYLVGKLHEIVEANQPDRVPAIKTLLDQLEKMESRRLKNGPPADPAAVLTAAESALDDPPPELVELLERKWGKRTVGT
jgi:hypothetical protein